MAAGGSGQAMDTIGALEASGSVQLSPGTVGTPYPRVTPRSPGRFALQVTIDAATHDKIQYARTLLSHRVPSGDLAQVLGQALDALIAKLEKRKFGATDRPRAVRGRTASAPGLDTPDVTRERRAIPAHVKRAVWERDGGRCTFRSDTGRRCEARSFLEYDHIEPVARGGRSGTGNVRLRCRTHNRLDAECVMGKGFMSTRVPAGTAPDVNATRSGNSSVMP